MGNSAEYSPLNLPSLRPPILLMQSTSVVAGEGSDRGVRIGLDAKQHILGGLQWQLTVNPDFRNIEDVVETIDFTYVPRFLPDRRPFFVEGSGYFPSSDIFYSRLVEDVAGGLKLFGKTGRTNTGFLLALESHRRKSLAARVSYDLNRYSVLDLNYAHREKTEGSPALRLGYSATYPGGRDHLWELSGNLTRCGGQNNWFVSVGYPMQTPGHWSFWLTYQRVGDKFSPSLGFAPEINFKWIGVGLNYYHFHRRGKVMDFGFNLFADQRHFLSGSMEGQLLDRSLNFSLYASWKNGWSLGLDMSRYHRPPFRDRTFWVSVGWNAFDRYRTGQINYQWGKRAQRTYRFLNLS